ncbi:MAG: hypothetical protein IJ404_04360 [Clostridia bacterium]|nr:hypothetical protein [Clostridia bacterium]
MSDSEAVRTKKYFIGANTSAGFINYGDDIFANLKKLYVIKGGPGTGKSTFMKKIAEKAEEKGHDVEYYYCSSDPSSLDGVVIPSLGIGVTDGTPPHIFEARYPGAKEEYLNLGEFWNSDFLSLCRDRIEEISGKKGRCFSSAYKYLSVSESVRAEKERTLLTCYEKEKAEKAVCRFMKTVGIGTKHALIPRQISAFSMNGESDFDTYKAECNRVIYIRDKRGIATFLFDEIIKKAAEQKLKMHVSRDCLYRVNAVAFPEKSVAVLLGDGDNVINSERFIANEKLGDVRKKLRFLTALENELRDCALSELRQAKEYHFILEDIYKEAMDFRSLEKMEKAFILKIIK